MLSGSYVAFCAEVALWIIIVHHNCHTHGELRISGYEFVVPCSELEQPETRNHELETKKEGPRLINSLGPDLYTNQLIT